MASSSRADRFQAVTSQKKIKEYQKMSCDERSKMRVSFGETKLNQTFLEVIETDPKYVQWFRSKYGNSQKASHLPFLYFVSLYVERLELTQETSPKGHPETMIPGFKAKAKAMDKKPIDLESDGVWSESEAGKPWSVVQEENSLIQAELSVQKDRISHMENSLSQIAPQLQHLTQMTAQSLQSQSR